MSIDSAESGLDLLQAARCEDLLYDDIKRLTVRGDFENRVILTLTQSGAHLLEGARGVGKSMLLRSAEIELDSKFAQDRKLAVYVNFKTSTLLEGVKAGERDGFQLWVNAKILQSLHEKLRFLDLIRNSNDNDPYQRIFGIKSVEKTGDFLNEKIHLLQRLAFASNKENVLKDIGPEFLDRVLDTGFLVELIKSVIDDFCLSRVTFLFDEAAHTFIPAQQEIFFEIFKLLHGERIACKAAVYPSVTSYGRNFEVGQDAIPIPMDRFEPGEHGRAARRLQFRSMIELRLPHGQVRKQVFQRGEMLDLCIELSTGNPRAFLHLLNRALDDGFSERAVTLAAQEFVDKELLPYHDNLAKRLPKFAAHVRKGLELLRGYMIPEIKKKNFRETKSGYQSAFFTVPRDISPNLKLALDVLSYSGILVPKGTVKIAGRETGIRYMIHLALLAAEKAFSDQKLNEAFRKLSLTDYREFSSSDPQIDQYLESLRVAGEHCVNCSAAVQPNSKFCSECGSRIEVQAMIGALLDEPISALSISSRLRDRIKNEFPRVGDLVQATRDEIMQIKYIKEVRSRIIKNAADEFISG
jgi:hypothetical protein